ncbi:Asp-tRNA(Asn)/Glu-tRNA(Gln) amidotransferase subunit GatB [Anaeromicrobium sediminis]|uniref:Aspartyl/glutamyl-tRNA(Asn/Gln) amidotransferase subunit B n=1 Tax=Anaeromicrobium sediminis TaxID=1478221 RepID=A0A267MG43_9FIRM|nr:Asp-tRNA(Asn)/Glu-tRNA(Gln) amidotransferase subunit GatB [Anaeromicrobium sediminis]PAB58549.1 Asp-tRNA(Asn)/Glu-tRNA(Gln) amidotransferase GatCAB subunit B [Anaeromicrobium sediminis]
MEYITVVGLEIHAELKTKSKIFCSCSTGFGEEENSQCCPICLGLPGTLPSLNKKVIEYAIRAGIGLNCEIARKSFMDRKNYFYPDLNKAYQISQYDKPLCENGHIQINDKRIGIKRIHIEEDAGKTIYTNEARLLNYNRSGVPLIEIVTEPDLSSSIETSECLEELKEILIYLDICDCKMEEGSLRCDVNINIESKDKTIRSNIVEIKNLNSFKAVKKAIEYEESRHRFLLRENKNTIRETRRWDENKKITVAMRKKEEAQDYRYFPEPDLLKIFVEESFIEEIRKGLPELPNEKRNRFILQYELPEYHINIMTKSKEMSNYFEEVVRTVKNPKMVSNFIISVLYKRLKDDRMDIEDLKYKIDDFVKLLELVVNGYISNNMAKKLYNIMHETGENPEIIMKEKGIIQLSNEKDIVKIVKEVLEENLKSIKDYKNGKKKVIGFLVGAVMKKTKGSANPQTVNEIILDILRKK